MKKRTIFQIFSLVCIITPLHIGAMEIGSPNGGICYFVFMPLEVLNYLASFLAWESQEECIERIGKVRLVPDNYRQELVSNTKRCLARTSSVDSMEIMTAFCPNETKIVLFELLCDTCFNPRLMILDTQKNELGKDVVMYDGKLEGGCYRAIGISGSGSMIAVVQKQPVADNNCLETVGKDILLIQKLEVAEKKLSIITKFDIPDGFVPLNLNFNKQGTSVTVRGNSVECKSEEQNKYLTFSLKNKIDDFVLKKVIIDKNNLLQDCFINKCVCKNFSCNKLLKVMSGY